jgi:hypothetical protein
MVILDWLQVFKDFTISSSIGFNTSNSESKSFAKQVLYWINPSDKVFDVLRSSVFKTLHDNNYSFDLFGTYTKIAENHNM